MNALRNLSVLAVLTTLLLASARAQNAYSGIYTGMFTLEISGFGVPEIVSEEVILTVDNHGNLRIGDDQIEGPIIGTVSADGILTMDSSTLGWLVSEGTISGGVIAASNTVMAGPIVQNYRLDATKTGEISVENDAPYITSVTAPTLNPETGHYEQDVIVYTGIDGLSYFEIVIFNLADFSEPKLFFQLRKIEP